MWVIDIYGRLCYSDGKSIIHYPGTYSDISLNLGPAYDENIFALNSYGQVEQLQPLEEVALIMQSFDESNYEAS